jgi:hypothetical protein
MFEHLDTSHAVDANFEGVYTKPFSPGGVIACSTGCQGNFDADLSSDSSLKFEWRVDDAKTKGVIVDLESSSATLDFEFNAGYDCDAEDSYYQYISGADINWSFDSRGDQEFSYDANKSLVEIGQCPGCSRCEIFVRLRFNSVDALSLNFASLTAEVNYDNSEIPAGPKTYDWTTATWSGIRYRYVSPDQFSFSTYELPASTDAPTRAPTEESVGQVISQTSGSSSLSVFASLVIGIIATVVLI